MNRSVLRRLLLPFVLIASGLLPLQSWAAPGDLDTSFGGGAGWVSTPNPRPVDDQARSVIQQADGKLVAVGYSYTNKGEDFALTRYNTDGTPDTTFNGTGTLTTNIIGLSSYDQAYSVIQQADGKLVAAGIGGSGGDFALVRYNTDGSLDTTFNGTGKLTTDIGLSSYDIAYSVIQQADGKLVAAGWSNNTGSKYDFAVVRYNDDGSLDTTFNGTGKQTTTIGLSSYDRAYSVIQQSDGKLVLAGSSYSSGGYEDFALVRYNTDGSLDTTFNGTGKLTTAIGESDDTANSVIQQADGKLVVAGRSNNGSFYAYFALARYNDDGSLDTTFNGTGKLTTIGEMVDVAQSVIQQADGKLVAAGYSDSGSGNIGVALVRYNSNGSLDTSFNGAGKLTTAFGATTDTYACSVIQQADGKLVAAGYNNNGSDDDFALVRYNSDGALDTTFDTDGKLLSNIAETSQAQARSVIQQADGKLVAAGFSWNNFALVRYNGDGTLDSTFNGTGQLTTFFGAPDDDIANSVIQQTDGKLVAAGYNGSGNKDFALVRYNSNGSLDTTFSGDGKLTTFIGAMSAADIPYSVIQQADGKLVAAGYSDNGSNLDFALVRYNSNGSLDTTFSGDGKLTTAVGASSSDVAQSVIQQTDGKLVAAGYSNSNGSNYDFALMRYNGDGALDTTFNGTGKLTTAIGTSNDYVFSVIQQADGKLVAAGRSHNGSNSDFVLVRYNSNGTLDTTFNGTGKLITAIGASDDEAYSVIQQADGKLVVAGSSYNGSNTDFALVRYNSDGSLDTGFNGTGQLTMAIGALVDIAYSVIQQADGKLAVAGYATGMPTGTEFVVARFESGQPDTDSDGYVDGLDTDDDNDGVADASDAFPLDATESVDGDGDGIGNNADTTPNGDDDSDSIDNATDNCIAVTNADQLNTDGDSEGNACDADDDNDGVTDSSDAFPLDSEATEDSDHDGMPDVLRPTAYNYFNGIGNLPWTIDHIAPALTWSVSSSGSGRTDGAMIKTDAPIPPPVGGPFGSVSFSSMQMQYTVHATGKLVFWYKCFASDNSYPINGSYFGTSARSSQYQMQCTAGDQWIRRQISLTPGNYRLSWTAAGTTQFFHVDDVEIFYSTLTEDLDDDNDGVADASDAFPLDASESIDTDGDGIGNNTDTTPNGDADGDGVDNNSDNCPSASNPLQHDEDGDGIGEPCDTDNDNDGVNDQTDNCLWVPNTDQLNTDGDNEGNVCDVDDDNDGMIDGSDLFPLDPLQAGDFTDSDGIDNAIDNCPYAVNSDQLNTDGDAQGNACDSDDDNDAISDVVDNCSTTINVAQTDTDNDGAGNACDTTPNGDTDSDGVDNLSDNCAAVSNADQLNTDGDSKGNACDNDDDNDGVPDVNDAFPLDASESVDTDGDGIGDNADNCPAVANADQLNADGDAQGDACDVLVNDPLLLLQHQGAAKGEQLGSSIAVADMNNDGVVDVLIGAPMANVSADGKILKKAGKIQIVSGKDNAVLRTLNGTATNQQFGSAIAVVTDQDSDSVPDIIVGEPLADRVALYSGSDGALLDVIAEGEAGDRFGAAVAVGDLNNDAAIDLIVGAPLADTFMKNCGVVTVFNGLSNQVLYRRKGDQAGEQFGAAVAVNDQQQVLIGAPLRDLILAIDNQVVKRKDVGRVQIFAGATASSSAALLRLSGAAAGDHFGAAISAANNSWAVGIPLADSAGKNAGTVQLFSGLNTTPITTLHGASAGDHFGSALNMQGDVNQDGMNDLAIGAAKFDASTTKDSGRVEVLSGAAL